MVRKMEQQWHNFIFLSIYTSLLFILESKFKVSPYCEWCFQRLKFHSWNMKSFTLINLKPLPFQVLSRWSGCLIRSHHKYMVIHLIALLKSWNAVKLSHWLNTALLHHRSQSWIRFYKAIFVASDSSISLSSSDNTFPKSYVEWHEVNK